MTAKKANTEEKSVTSETNDELTTRRNKIISSLRPLLLTKREMWKGGSVVRAKHAQEASCFQPIVDEINEIGLQLGESALVIDQIRAEG